MIRGRDSDQFSITLLLEPGKDAAREGRHELRAFLTERHVESVRIEVAELVLSELVTNAVTASRAEVEVYARLDHEAVRIWVSDEIAISPHPHEPSLQGGGWGLHIIHEVSTRWGVRPRVDGHPGKTVWAEVLLA